MSQRTDSVPLWTAYVNSDVFFKSEETPERLGEDKSEEPLQRMGEDKSEEPPERMGEDKWEEPPEQLGDENNGRGATEAQPCDRQKDIPSGHGLFDDISDGAGNVAKGGCASEQSVEDHVEGSFEGDWFEDIALCEEDSQSFDSFFFQTEMILRNRAASHNGPLQLAFF
eukprot:475319-Pyramimonas_sp.AAC.2